MKEKSEVEIQFDKIERLIANARMLHEDCDVRFIVRKATQECFNLEQLLRKKIVGF